MYQADDEEVFVIDGHTHFWDASPENWRNKYGEGWIRCFYDYHTALSPKEYLWPFEKYCKYDEQTMIQDLFFEGHVDMGIMTSTYLYEFFKNGFNSHIQNNILKEKYPHRFILCGSFDPRAEQKGLDEYPLSPASSEGVGHSRAKVAHLLVCGRFCLPDGGRYSPEAPRRSRCYGCHCPFERSFRVAGD